MKRAPHSEQIRGIIWEMQKGGYRHVWPALMEAPTLRDKITVLVRKFEQSGNQLRDINRRTALALYWDTVSKVGGWDSV
jgi:hypothetical protein